MPHRRSVAVTAGAVLGLLAFVASAQAQNGRVTGIVREEGGQPLKGATITADNESIGQSFTATTDDKGRFNMIGLRSGTWRFIAQAPGYAPEGGLMNIRTGGVNGPVTFELKHSGVAFFGALGGVSNKDIQEDLEEADGLYEQQKWDEAISAYRSLLNRIPVITAINLQIGSAYRNKKDYASALMAYNEVLKADPSNEKAKIQIAMTALERGDAGAAEETLLRAADDPLASRDVFYSLGEVKLATSDLDAAAMWFQKASDADPNWAKPLLRLGETALRQGDSDGAVRLLTKAVEVDPTAPEADTAKTVLESLKK